MVFFLEKSLFEFDVCIAAVSVGAVLYHLLVSCSDAIVSLVVVR